MLRYWDCWTSRPLSTASSTWFCCGVCIQRSDWRTSSSSGSSRSCWIARSRLRSDWTRPKPRSCGWVLVNSSPSLTSSMCAFCRRVSESRTQPVTSASSLTASCRCQLTPLRYVEAVNYQLYGNCDRLSGRCLKMPVRHSSSRSSPVAWTTVIHCSSATLMDCWAGCSLFRMPPLVWLLALGAATTTPVLRLLHWRVDFNVATLAHRSLSGNSASYLADDCRLVADTRERRLRSAEHRTCVVTRTHSTFGDRAFAAAIVGSGCH